MRGTGQRPGYDRDPREPQCDRKATQLSFSPKVFGRCCEAASLLRDGNDFAFAEVISTAVAA